MGVPPEPPCPVPEPHAIQQEALEALEQTRSERNAAGLVVLATGLGKTWLAAFDTDRFGAKRVLFVAHREEILRQALDTFRRIRPEATLGLYTGTEKDPSADVLFASIQTLGKKAHLRNFGSNAFDYIVVDEFHHAAARTYRQLIDHFKPEFLLGLTATPERTDGGDFLALCGENLVYRCDLLEGIERERLAPFRYIGVPDEVDYASIPWRSRRFDEKALTNAIATQERAANVFDQYRKTPAIEPWLSAALTATLISWRSTSANTVLQAQLFTPVPIARPEPNLSKNCETASSTSSSPSICSTRAWTFLPSIQS